MMPETAHDGEADRTGCELVRQRADTLLAEFAALMADVAADPDRPDLARRMSLLTAALREQRAWLAGHVLADEYAGAIEARAEARGYQRGLAAATAPGQRKGRHATQRSNVLLNVVRVLAPVAAGAGWLLRHAGRHPAAAVKASLAAHKIAVPIATTLAAGGTAAVLTVTALGPAATVPLTSSAAGPAPAATAWAADTAAVFVADRPDRHTPEDSVRGARKDSQSLAPVPLAAITPSSPPASQPSAAATSSSPAAPAGPAVLEVSTAAIDLTSTPAAVITLTATGGGWVSWHIRAGGTDLDFSATRGVLQAGQAAEVTVSLDATQDGATAQVFDVNGQPVTVTFPAPQPAGTSAATDTPSPVSTDEVPTPGAT